MSLLRGTAKEALEQFNPKTDNPNGDGFDKVPAGEHDAVLLNATHKVYDSGWEAFSIEIGVVGGEHDGRKESINVGFRGDKIPEFVFNKNIKMVAQLAFVSGLELVDADWEDESALQWAFKPAVGAQFIMDIKEAPNKKDPSNPYRNYFFKQYENVIESLTISDDDMPF